MITSSPLDIVMIGPFPEEGSLIKNGMQTSVHALAQALKGKDGVGSILGISMPFKETASRPVKTVDMDGIEVLQLNAPLKLMISTALHIPAILRKIRACQNPVVHLHGSGLMEALLCVLMRLQRIHCVWTLHGIAEKETRARMHEQPTFGNFMRYLLYTFLERLMLLITPSVIVDTHYVKETLSRKDCIVIPQGIFIDEFRKLEIPEKKEKLIACVGVIDPRKGHLQTIDAFAQLKKYQPEAKLVIAGAMRDARYLESIKRSIELLGLEDSVTVEVDQPRARVLDILSRAQVFTLHSREESQGIALCEALACGLPVVSTRVGGIPYVVKDLETGYLVTFGDINGVAAALKKLLTNDILRKEMSDRAKEASNEFSWNGISTRIMQVYRSCNAANATPDKKRKASA